MNKRDVQRHQNIIGKLAKERAMQNSKEVVVKRRDIYEGANALQEIGEKDLKLIIVHRLALTKRSASAETDLMDESQNKLSDRYMLRDDDGNKVPSDQGFKLDPEKLDDFQKEQREFMKEEVELTVYPIKSTDFGEKAKLKSNTVAGLLAIQAYEIVDDEGKDED